VLPPPDKAAPDSPADVAHCPDVEEMMRGNGMSAATGLPKITPSAMPPWDVEQMRAFACAYACASSDADAYLLAWSVVEDRRPLRNHNAVYAIAHPAPRAGDPPSPAWTVVIMYRHADNTWWNINNGIHGHARPVTRFARRPTVKHIDKLLDLDDWMFDHEARSEGFRILAGNVIQEVWPTATGGDPTRFFPSGIER
jgi:hypothetical protein